MAEHPLEDLFARLEREREQADRLYNDALTAVDRAIQQPSPLPALPRPTDDTQMSALNAAWDIMPPSRAQGGTPGGLPGRPAFERGLRGRVQQFVWRLVGPIFEAQKQFNASLVDHLNRNVAARQHADASVVALLDIIRREFDALAGFESLLVQFLQTITVYVDTKDRSLGGSELRERLALAEQRIVALKRELDAGRVGPGTAVPTGSSAESPVASPGGASTEAFGGAVESLTYLGFEDRFRGSQEEIRGRVEDYLPILTAASDVVDVGCGRGELLDLLVERGVRARGVDMNAAMVELCRSRGLDVERSDALSFLERQPDATIGGLVATQVVEHMEPAYLLKFLEAASVKLRAGAPLILETINPACWMAFFDCYIRDLTHARPLHPETLRYLVQASGFTRIEIQYREPVSERDRLDRVPSPGASSGATPELASVIAALNAHADKLNARLFSSMDYAIIARR